MFLVFDLMWKGELFDYFIEKVVFFEKEIRFIMWFLLEVVSFFYVNNIVY